MTPLWLSSFQNGAWSALAPLGQLGYGTAMLRLRSRAASTFETWHPGLDPGGPADFPFKTPVRIYASLPGLNGGAQTVIFAGFRSDNPRRAIPNSGGVGQLSVFSDAWWLLDHTIFKHFWWSQLPGQNQLTQNFFSRIMLFQDINNGPNGAWGFLSAQAQLQQILNYAANTSGIAIQPGVIDALQNLPPYPVRALSCAAAINQVLKTVPDAITYFDYTQPTPALNIRQRQNMTAVTLPFGGRDANGRAHKMSSLRDMPELQASGVLLEYQLTSQLNGASVVSWTNDAYPPGTDGTQPFQINIPIDLRGGSLNTVQGIVTAIPVDPTHVAFWFRHKPDLDTPEILMDGVAPIIDTTINSGSPYGITITDNNGNPVNLAALPNEVIGNALIAPWMKLNNGTQVIGEEVTVTAYLRYARRKILQNGTPQIIEQVTSHQTSARIKLTNSPVGAQTYKATASSAQGELIPAGLAQFLYDATSALQYEGTHEILDDPLTGVYDIIGPQNLLNLSGASSNWTGINATIYSAEIDFFHNRTVLQLGPHKHISANELVDLINMWSVRIEIDNPAVRNTGQSASGNNVDIGLDAQKENTSHGLPESSLKTIINELGGGGYTGLTWDSINNGGQIVAQTYDAEGNPDPTQPSIKADLQTLGATNGVGRAAAWRWMTVCAVDGNGNPIAGQFNKALFLCTAPEALTDA